MIIPKKQNKGISDCPSMNKRLHLLQYKPTNQLLNTGQSLNTRHAQLFRKFIILFTLSAPPSGQCLCTKRLAIDGQPKIYSCD